VIANHNRDLGVLLEADLKMTTLLFSWSVKASAIYGKLRAVFIPTVLSDEHLLHRSASACKLRHSINCCGRERF